MTSDPMTLEVMLGATRLADLVPDALMPVVLEEIKGRRGFFEIVLDFHQREVDDLAVHIVDSICEDLERLKP